MAAWSRAFCFAPARSQSWPGVVTPRAIYLVGRAYCSAGFVPLEGESADGKCNVDGGPRHRAALAGVAAGIETPEPTRSWRPVAHHDLVTSLVQELGGHGLVVAEEQYCTTGPKNERLIGVLDLVSPSNTPEFGMGLASSAGNDSRTAVR